MSVFEHVRLAPADPILGLAEAFKADERTSKVNLGIGVYLDENGHLPLMNCVHAAENRLAAAAKPHAYLGCRREPAGCSRETTRLSRHRWPPGLRSPGARTGLRR